MKHVAGMTLTELLVTIAILSLVTMAALPSYTGLQARQSLKSAQGGIQSLLYKMQQLTLAPPASASTSRYEVIGYGVFFFRQGETQPILSGCVVDTTADFVAMYKFVRFTNSDSTIRAFPAGATPNPENPEDPGCGGKAINPLRDTANFYVLPRDVRLSDSSEPANFPWLVSRPLASLGQRFGDFPSPYTNPLSASPDSSVKVVVEHKSIKLASSGKAVSRFIRFSNASNGITVSSGINQ